MLLPTPRAEERMQRNSQDNGVALSTAVTLLPTPAVNDMGEGKTVEHWDEWPATMQAKHGNGNGHGKSLAIEAQRLLPTPVADNSRGLPSSGTDYASLPNAVCALLPTPRATDGTKGGPNQRGSSGDLMLPSAVHLLPTPTAGTQAKSRRAMTASTENGRRSGGGQSSPLGLDEVVALASGVTPEHLPEYEDLPPASRAIVDGFERASAAWGDYSPAIARWEHVTGRTAPAPTEPGPKGNPRLSPAFVEWMMGLPAGHVTDPAIGLTRNEQLKALGNGVVWQQCAEATRWWLTQVEAVTA